MAGPSADEVARSVYAKGFPKTVVVTEDMVKGIFETSGRVRSVKLRKDEKTGAFRGSVYVEFEKESAAIRAVANPPLQPGAREPLSVMLRREYERRAMEFEASGKGGDSSRGVSGERQKERERDGSLKSLSSFDQSPTKRARMEGSRRGSSASAATTTLPAAGPGNVNPVAQWQVVAEEREKRLKALEEALKTEKENALKAQEEMEECIKRKHMAMKKLVDKEAEVGRLDEELAALRAQMHSRIDAMKEAHDTRVHELESRVDVNKGEIEALKRSKQEAERETKGGTAGYTAPQTPQSTSEDPLGDEL